MAALIALAWEASSAPATFAACSEIPVTEILLVAVVVIAPPSSFVSVSG